MKDSKIPVYLRILAIVTTLITILVLTLGLPKEILLLTIGVVLSMLLYEKYRYRVGGILALPLLVLYALSSPTVALWLILVVAIDWFIIENIFKKTILYGRRLFFMSCLISIALTFGLYLIVDHMPVYITVIPGIMAYNLHYEKNSNENMKRSLGLLLWHMGILIVVGVMLGV